MDYSHLSLLLLVLGLALLAAEVFIPSGGMILIASMACFAGSIWCAWNAWWDYNRTAWWTYVGALLVLLPVTVGSAFYLLPRTSFGRKILLDAPSLDEVTPYAAEAEHLQQMVGRYGKTVTMLGPGGLAVVDGERVHCESEGVLIEAGETVQVIGVKANRLVVRMGSPADESPHELTDERDVADERPLDFDIPQS